MTMLSRALSVLLCVAILWLAAPLSVALAQGPAAENKTRIKLAARQATLTQLISRDLCFVMAGMQPEHYAEKAKSAIRQFENTLTGLAVGDDTLGIPAEEIGALRDQYAQVGETWQVLGPASRQIAAGDLHSVAMRQLMQFGILAEQEADAVTAHVIDAHGAGLPDGLPHAVHAVQRLATLASRASKEICFVTLNIDEAHYRSTLMDTIAEMDRTIGLLQDGSEAADIIAPPNRRAARQLDRIVRAWRDLSAALTTATENDVMDTGQRALLANLGNQIVFEVNTTIGTYLY
ncbi:type IV pili methyl-accepting chemotaxis transducer N-terminal domain-containing protein [Tateyamaria sp. SN6-1]|uniref:type IV pili methyl-accepting chemotaxis transducer N-terminal domain-containing protein n=1 Tax=Tateyamaria sp. SN6-1 TaxID=3092148 RepID=UPI0039F58741